MSEKELVRFSRMKKRDFKEFNQIEAQGWIVNRCVIIEQLINDIIISYFNPSNRALFFSHVLNSTVMHFGGKLKILNAIGIQNSTFQNLQRIGNIRNAFAHTNISHKMHMLKREEGFETNVTDHLNVMNGAGEIKPKDPYLLMGEFLECYKKIEPELQELIEKLKSEKK